MILCADPKAQYCARREEIDAALHRVLDSGRYVLGAEVAQFEKEFAAYLGAGFAIGVASGTDALHLALAALEIKPGDEVITVSHTAAGTVTGIRLAGATPVFVDIHLDDYTIDPDAIRAAITPRTRAIVPVHLYGLPVDLASVLDIAEKHSLSVIEDCAQAHGATYQGRRVGSIAHIGCFSFYPTKNLGAIGDGGAVVTNDEHLAEKVRLLREYGWADRYVSETEGWNSRLDEIQAAVLRVKLRHLDSDNSLRRKLAETYRGELADVPLVLPSSKEGCEHVYHQFVVRSERRSALQTHLKAKGIHTLVHYPIPLHRQPAYRHFPCGNSMARTEHAAHEVLSLPIYPELDEPKVREIIRAVLEFR